MATRPPRRRQPHAHFHVMSRGTKRWNIFLDDADRQRFINLLSATCKRYEIDVTAYCLMGNHFHLLVYCRDPVLSSAMRDLKSRYAKYFNAEHLGSGPVFEGPFVEVPVLSDEQLKIAVRYIHRNPLDLDPNVCLATAPWSSHSVYLGLRKEPRWMNTTTARTLFGASYQQDVEMPLPSDKIQNSVIQSVTSPGDVTLYGADERSLAWIRRQVAAASGREISEVSTDNRNGLIGIAVILAIDACGFASNEIADPYGFKTASAVRMAAKRARERLQADGQLQLVYQSISGQV